MPSSLMKWFDESAGIVSSLGAYASAKDREDAYWRILIANVSYTGEPAPPAYYQSYQPFLNLNRALLRSHSPSYDGDATGDMISEAGNWNIAFAANKERRLFATRRGYVGSGPPWMSNNDVVCIIHGADTPFLIRKSPTSDDGKVVYTLVGECYVHGMMNGEGLELGAAQEITLV